MKLIQRTIHQLLWAGLIFLIFLFLFESFIVVPSWLQVVGRMHPLLLHFPIVLLLISLISFWQTKEWFAPEVGAAFRMLAAATSILTAIMGMILSIESSDKGDTLFFHKWAGLATAVSSFCIYHFYEYLNTHIKIGKTISVSALLLLLMTGHWGADLTHGNDYLLAPVLASTQKHLKASEMKMYPDLIQPILKDKCGNCHMGFSRKGGLSLDDSISMMKGGKEGPSIMIGNPEKSILIGRMHLPVHDKKHMPVYGKPQLSLDEINLLELWIRKGAPFQQRIMDRPETDSLRIQALQFVEPMLSSENETEYDFAAADASTISKLNNNYRVIKQLGNHSPALAVSFFGVANYSSAALKELSGIRKQIIHLNLAKMPATDGDVDWISDLPHLQRLNLNYTGITDESMRQLKKMTSLESLSIAGTSITAKGLEQVMQMPALKELFIWDSKLSIAEVNQLQQKNHRVNIETGFLGGDTMVVPLNPPIVKSAQGFFVNQKEIVLDHVIKGVQIKYTLEGTDPDSGGHVFTYSKPFNVDSSCTLMVKAYKKGWGNSRMVQADFRKAGIPILNTLLVTPPDPKYNLRADKILFDLDPGDARDFGTKWLGYQKNNAVIVADLGSSKKVSSLQMISLHNSGSHIFPPVSIKLYGSNDQQGWNLIKQQQIEIPKKNFPAIAYTYQLNFTPSQFRYLKLESSPLKKLPDWHPQKGLPAWLFISELVVN